MSLANKIRAPRIKAEAEFTVREPHNIANRLRLVTLMLHVALLLCCANGALAQTTDSRVDSDRDGLTDQFEQAILEKFRPTFMISPTDCAARPSRFKAGYSRPEAASADGTIYGQVFPVPGGRIEVHFFTLWDRDCGRNSHPLDVEHVAALISGEPGPEWKAAFWFAGAHEKTVCDISSGARSEALAAEHHGPQVWSSSGKHALYLRQGMCQSGCGADSCDGNVELARNGSVVNLGEPGAPANGSMWIASPEWVLSDRMDTDFSAEVMARLHATARDEVTTLRGRSPLRGTIQGSDAVVDSASSAAQHTGTALDEANSQTSRSVGDATRATGRSLARAWKAVFGRKPAPPRR